MGYPKTGACSVWSASNDNEFRVVEAMNSDVLLRLDNLDSPMHLSIEKQIYTKEPWNAIERRVTTFTGGHPPIPLLLNLFVSSCNPLASFFRSPGYKSRRICLKQCSWPESGDNPMQ